MRADIYRKPFEFQEITSPIYGYLSLYMSHLTRSGVILPYSLVLKIKILWGNDLNALPPQRIFTLNSKHYLLKKTLDLLAN